MHRPARFPLFCALLVLAGCVTINVYFPAAAAEQAAQKFIGKVIGDAPQPAPASSTPPPAPPQGKGAGAMLLDLVIPAAHAQSPNLTVSTPRLDTLRAAMHARFESSLKALLDAGAIGFTQDGMVALHDASKVPLAERNQVRTVIEAENRDRAEVYRAIAEANGHPEWASQIQATFARNWIAKARSGWYWQDSNGAWQRK